MLWIGGAAVGAVLAVLIAWQVGQFQSRGEVDRLTSELIWADARLNALEARRLIHRATLQLESRNFGSAQQLVDEAKRFMAASENGIGDEAAAKLISELEAFETNVDPNVGKQVAKLVALAKALDELVPAPELPHGVEPTAPAAAAEPAPTTEPAAGE